MGEGSIYYLKAPYLMYCTANKQLSSAQVSHNVYVNLFRDCFFILSVCLDRCHCNALGGIKGSRLCLL